MDLVPWRSQDLEWVWLCNILCLRGNMMWNFHLIRGRIESHIFKLIPEASIPTCLHKKQLLDWRNWKKLLNMLKTLEGGIKFSSQNTPHPLAPCPAKKKVEAFFLLLLLLKKGKKEKKSRKGLCRVNFKLEASRTEKLDKNSYFLVKW